MKSVVRTSGFLVGIFLILIWLGLHTVNAAAQIAPDPADFELGSDIWLEVSKPGSGTSGLNSPQVRVVVYLPSSSGSITIINGNDGCSGESATALTNYTFYRGATPDLALDYITYHSQGWFTCGSKAQSVSGLSPLTVGTQTYYPVTLIVDHVGTGGLNQFKIQASSGGIVSYYGGGTHFTVQDRVNSSSRSQFRFKFAPPCDYTTASWRNFGWKDDDHWGLGGDWNQPNVYSNAGTTRANEFAMTIIERNSSGTETARWKMGWNTGYPPGPSNGRGNYQILADTFATGPTLSDPYGWIGSDTTNGNNTAYVRVWVQPNHKYEWIWDKVDEDNGVHFSLPFNDIYYDVNCTNFNYNPRLLSGPSTPENGAVVYPGQTLHIVGDATNTGTTTGPTHNMHIFPSVGNGIVTPGSSSGASWVGTRAEWNSRPAIGSGGNSADQYANYTVSSSAAAGSQICFRVRVSPDTPANSGYQYTGTTAWCYTVGATLSWNYNPRFVGGSTANNAVVRPGDTITVVGDAANVGGGTGTSFTLQTLVPSAYRTYVTGSTVSSGGTLGGSPAYYSQWSNEGPIAAGGNTANRTTTYRVNNNVASGTTICIQVRINPHAGTSTPPPPAATSSGWENVQRCYTVDREEYDHVPSINILDDTGSGESGVQIMRGDNFRTRATIVNNDVGREPYQTQSFASSGGQFVSLRPSATSPSYAATLANPNDGYRWQDNNGVGAGSGDQFTGGFRSNLGSNLGRDLVCFQSYVNPAEGEVGWPTPVVRERWSSPACADIYDEFDYGIIGGGITVFPGDTFDVTVVNNGGGPGDSNTAYSVSGPFIISDSGSLGSIPPVSSVVVPVQVANNAPVGTICITFRVTPGAGRVYDNAGNDTYITSASETANGNDVCITIAESPYLEVYGADVQAGGVFGDLNDPFVCPSGTAAGGNARVESVARTSPDRGSFTEFGLFATGGIVDFGSDGLIGGTLTTFANTPTLGDYSDDGKCILNYFGLFEPEATSTSSTSFSQDGQYIRNGSFTNNGATINAGQQLIMLVNGNVTLNDDVVYANYSASQPRNVPFFMLIATGNIRIHSSVDRLDGAYVSLGTINTCYNLNPGSATITSACDNDLDINGIFVAQDVDFNRTEGGLIRGGPAETFNFSPELYLAIPNFRSPFFGDFDIEQFKDLPPVY